MKYCRLAAAGVLISLFNAAPALAEDVPVLTGEWDCVEQGSASTSGLSGPGYRLAFIVDAQKGPVFSGHVKWTESRSDVADHQLAWRKIHEEDGDDVTFWADIYGVFALGPGQFSFTESGDPGYHFGRVIDTDTIEFVYLEAGKTPLAALRRCTRE